MKKFKLLLVSTMLAFALSGCGDTSLEEGIPYDAIDSEEEYVALKEQLKAEIKAEMAAEVAAEKVQTENTMENNEVELSSETKDDELTLDDINEEDIKYKIFSNDIVASAIANGELAKTGDPEIDAFLQRFYEKAMDGDTYIQFMLELAEASGVDINVIDDLIDYNASRRIGVWVDGLEELINNSGDEERSVSE